MGIRITPSTWREPLRIIDSWLPSPKQRAVTHRGLPQLLQRFARAGWLGKGRVASTSSTLGACEPVHALIPSRACRVRVMRATVTGTRTDARLVISGRMADVCAELERLEALEQLQQTAPI